MADSTRIADPLQEAIANFTSSKPIFNVIEFNQTNVAPQDPSILSGGLLWAQAGLTTSLIFTDNTGVDHDLVTGGGSFAPAIHTHSAADITSGTLSITRGGTGQSTATAALNALLPSQTGNNGKLLSTDGLGSVSWISAGGQVDSVSDDSTATGATLKSSESTATDIRLKSILAGTNISVTTSGTGDIVLATLATATQPEADAGSAANKIITPSTLAAFNVAGFTNGTLSSSRLPLATTAIVGALETATQGEADAGSVGDKIITPSTLATFNVAGFTNGTIPSARLPLSTTTTVGALETATQGEADAGSAGDKIITPATLAGYIDGRTETDNLSSSATTYWTSLSTKQYADSIASGFSQKAPCVIASIADVDIFTGTLTPIGLDTGGPALNVDDHVLVKDQTDPTENGVYHAKVGAWVRADDMDGTPSTSEVTVGVATFVINGATWAGYNFVATSPGKVSGNVISLGVDAINWSPISQISNDASSLTSGTLAAARLPLATTTAVGALETATQPEADTGSVTDKIITPATLKGFNVSGFTSGALPIVRGGTGQTTANASFNALVPTQTANSGKYLTTDGTDTSWGTIIPGATNIDGLTDSRKDIINKILQIGFKGTTTAQNSIWITPNNQPVFLTNASQNNVVIAASAGSMGNCSSGTQNIAIGAGAPASILGSLTTGGQNIAIGASTTLNAVVSGGNNLGIGIAALAGATGNSNIGLSTGAGRFLTSGDNNILIGRDSNPSTGFTALTGCIVLGANSLTGTTTNSDQIVIGTSVTGCGVTRSLTLPNNLAVQAGANLRVLSLSTTTGQVGPINDGTVGQVLTTNGSGAVLWSSIPSSSSVATKTPCRVRTTAPLTYTASGTGVGKTLTNAGTQAALSLDSVTLALTNRVLVANEASGNGEFVIATGGGSYIPSDIQSDSFGNKYIIGNFTGTIQFGATPAITASATNDCFIAKIDSSNTYSWAVKTNCTGGTSYHKMRIDSSNNIIAAMVAGIDAPGGSTIQPSGLSSISLSGYGDPYIVKINNPEIDPGTFQWHINGVGGGDYDMGYSLALDSSNNIYISGVYRFIITFGGTTLTGFGANYVAFWAKLNAAGNTWQWAFQPIAVNGSSEGLDIVCDTANNLWIIANQGSNFTYGAFTVAPSGQALIKIDSSGVVLNAISASSGSPYSKNLTINPANNHIYYIGRYFGSATVAGVALNSVGLEDIYVASISDTGTYQWAVSAGGTGSEFTNNLFPDIVFENNTLHITGAFSGTANFGIYPLTSLGGHDVFYATLNTSGVFQSAIRFGDAGTNSGVALTITSGTTYILGNEKIYYISVNGKNNGMYTVTDTGSVSTNWVLTRATDFDQDSEITSGVLVTISEGTLYGNSIQQLTTLNPITIDDTGLTFQGISKVGTVTSGTWNASSIGLAYGGTGQTTANASFNALAPIQTSNSGKYLTTDGTNTSWASVGSSGTLVAWAYAAISLPIGSGSSGDPVATWTVDNNGGRWTVGSSAPHITINTAGTYEFVMDFTFSGGSIGGAGSVVSRFLVNGSPGNSSLEQFIETNISSFNNGSISNTFYVALSPGDLIRSNIFNSGTGVTITVNKWHMTVKFLF